MLSAEHRPTATQEVESRPRHAVVMRETIFDNFDHAVFGMQLAGHRHLTAHRAKCRLRLAALV